VNALLACHQPAIRVIERGGTPGTVRKAIGAARKALHESRELKLALPHFDRRWSRHQRS
jgi:hypothetical protein